MLTFIMVCALLFGAFLGGGTKRLFRKIGDRSSEFYPEENEVRRDGSYIYEEFLSTQFDRSIAILSHFLDSFECNASIPGRCYPRATAT